jgi:outer membrane protein assembly factor BamA
VSSDEVVIEVRVNERWYIWPSPILEVADPNFNTWWRNGADLDRINFGLYLYRYNFRGLNETVYLKLQFGYAQQFALRYRVPNLSKDQKWGMSIGGGYFQQKEITIGTINNERYFHKPVDGNARTSWRVDGDLSLRPKHDLRHTWRLGYTQAEVVDSVALLTPDYFGDGASFTAYLNLGYTLAWDTRDARTFALSGSFAQWKIDRLGLGVLGEAEPDVTVTSATVKHWWKVAKRVVVQGGLEGKATIGGTVPYFVQEGLGYDHYVRGYEYYVIDGSHFVLGKLNTMVQLIAPRDYYVEPIPVESFRTLHVALYLNLYMDGGYVWDDQYDEVNPLANEWTSGFGAGLDLVTSYDQVLRAEYSVNALGEDGFFLHFTQPF